MPPKHKHPWRNQYAEILGLKITSRDPKTRKVDAATYFFSQKFGRETTPNGSELQKCKKTKAFQTFTKDKIKPSNIKSHMQNQYPIKWKKYIEARDNKETAPDVFEAFFEQSKLQAFYFESQDVNGQHFYSIDEDIVEVVAKELLMDNQDKLDGDITMRAFKTVKDDSGKVLSYTVAVKKKAQFNHLLDLVAASLSFVQIVKAICSDCENSDAAEKVGSVSPGEASSMARTRCAIGLQSLSEIMKVSWAFSIGADEANKQGRTLTLM